MSNLKLVILVMIFFIAIIILPCFFQSKWQIGVIKSDEDQKVIVDERYSSLTRILNKSDTHSFSYINAHG